MNSPAPDAPITEDVQKCLVQKFDLADDMMILSFVIPGVKRYNFTLDKNGRQAVSNMTRLIVPTYGPNDMPRNNVA